MKVLVLAENMEYARILMREFYRENLDEISGHSDNNLYFKDDSVVTFVSVHTPKDIIYTNAFDQILTTEYVYHYHRDILGFIESRVASDSIIPREYIVTIIEE